DTRALTAVLARDARLREALRERPSDGTPLVLATGGFQANRDLVREHITREADAMALRASPWSTGDGLRIGLAAGASTSNGLEQVYGRHLPALPARIDEPGFGPPAHLS